MQAPLVYSTDFPVYGVDFTVNDELIAVGGVGPSGKNKIVALNIDEQSRKLKRLAKHELPLQEDCPMSVGCHPNSPLFAVGANGSEADIRSGHNKNCRLFNFEAGSITPTSRVATNETNKDPEKYQRVTRFSRSGSHLISGSTDDTVSVLKIPDLAKVFSQRIKHFQDASIDDEEKFIAVAARDKLCIVSLESNTIVDMVPAPKLNHTSCEFRACRYAKSASGQKLYAVVNPISRGGSFVCVWSLHASPARRYPMKRKTSASVCRNSITNFSVSPNGDLLAYTSSDLSVGLVDAKTLRPVLHINQAHPFEITTLAFNRSSSLLAFAGWDTHVRILIVPDHLELGIDYDTPIYVSLCMLMFALFMHILVQLAENYNE